MPPRSEPHTRSTLPQKIAPTRPHTRRDSESKPHRPAQLARDQSRVSEDDDDIHVIKRNGKKEVVRYDKITSRIKKLCYGLDSKYIKPNVCFGVLRCCGAFTPSRRLASISQ